MSLTVVTDRFQVDVCFSTEMGSQAAADALRDAGLTYNDLQAAVASYCYGDPTCGQRALYGIYLHVYIFVVGRLLVLYGQTFAYCSSIL